MLPHFDVFEKKEKNMEKLRKGLKKGEYFEDGGRIFVIDEVLEDGMYISHMETPKEGGMTAAEMKEKLKSLGLPTSGSKAELAERLAAAETEEETEKESEERTETEEESEEE